MDNLENNIINLKKEVTISNKDYLELISHKIITEEIYIKNKLKNFLLLRQIIYLVSKVYRLVSVRELHQILQKNNIKISQITLLDYINYMIKANLVKKVFRYDLKRENTSTAKAKYLFLNTGIRYALSNFDLTKSIINENLVYEKLQKNNLEVFTGKNGTFDFTFLCGTEVVHISHNTEKKEVIKEARKLLKIPGNYNKIMIVYSIKGIGLRPSTYFPLQIMEIEEYLGK